MFDMTLKFESEIFVKAFDKDFEKMLSQFGGSVDGYGKIVKPDHTVNIANSAVLPNDEFVNILKDNIMEALVKSFENDNSMNAKVQNVRYVGITKIEQKENT